MIGRRFIPRLIKATPKGGLFLSRTGSQYYGHTGTGGGLIARIAAGKPMTRGVAVKSAFGSSMRSNYGAGVHRTAVRQLKHQRATSTGLRSRLGLPQPSAWGHR